MRKAARVLLLVGLGVLTAGAGGLWWAARKALGPDNALRAILAADDAERGPEPHVSGRHRA